MKYPIGAARSETNAKQTSSESMIVMVTAERARVCRWTCCAGFILVGTSLFAQDSLSATQRDDRYFPLSRVSSVYKPYVIASGNRLQKPGMERITAAGMLQYGPDGGAAAVPAQIIWQLPLKIRLDDSSTSLAYDGKDVGQALPRTSKDADTIETLLEDSLEGFLAIKKGGSSRFLGTGFRSENPKNAQFFDIALVTYAAKFRAGAESLKAYYFDTDTHLLARVIYESQAGAIVQVTLTDWRDVQGTKVPFVIERREGGIVTMRLTLSSALISPSLDVTPFAGK